VGDISFANASWASEPQMFTARHITLAPFFWRTIGGQLAFRAIEADGIDLRIETGPDNQGNWQFDAPDKPKKDEDSSPPDVEIRRLVLQDSRIHVLEPALKTEVTVEARTEDTDKADVNRLRLDGKGTYRDAPFSLEARFDVPRRIDAESLVVDTQIDAAAGATKLHASGQLPAAITTRGVTVDVKMSGEDLGALYPLVGIALPETPPYDLGGQLEWKGRRIDWKGFSGKVGDSDLRGDASLELGGARPKITANLISSRLDFDDLGSLLGIPPATGEGETASPKQQKTKAELAARNRVLPNEPLDLAKLRSVDADVTLKAERINAPKLPVRTLQAHVTLEDGVLKADPFDFDAASGKLRTRIVFDTHSDPLNYDFRLDLKGLKLAELVPNVESLKDAVGVIDGRFQLRGKGNSVAAMFAGADGELQFIMTGGEVSNLLIELAGLDVAESLKFLLGKDKKVGIRCAYADFSVKQGVAGADALALDTTDTALLGKGSIDLRDERFDIALFPKPKDKSPISLRTPLKITGSFLHPSFHPEAAPLILRGAAVAALAVLAPPAALLGLVETGPGKDFNCGPGKREGTVDDTKHADDGKSGKRTRPPGPRPANRL
jgi:uncharacterized protein involved in outer membrane biogenesis